MCIHYTALLLHRHIVYIIHITVQIIDITQYTLMYVQCTCMYYSERSRNSDTSQ